jgi:uncharacterized membrane protein
MTYLVDNPAVAFGLLTLVLGVIFYTSQSKTLIYKHFYRFIPPLLLCYFIPSLLHTFHIIPFDFPCHEILNGTLHVDAKTLLLCQQSTTPESTTIPAIGADLYYVASRFLLPASLVLLTLSVDFKRLKLLGPKALIMFLTGTLGIVIGGPIALLTISLFNPDIASGDVWRGLTTVAGSWIGGGANQTAMKEVYEVPSTIFSSMIAVDVIIANIWMAILLYMASHAKRIDAKMGANTQVIDTLKKTVESFTQKHEKIPHLHDFILILALAFGVTAVGHIVADFLAPYIMEHWPELKKYSLTSTFFWLIVTVTTVGLFLSTTRLRRLEMVGSSKIGSVFIYLLVATIGLQMDISAILKTPWLFAIGAIWMLVHALLMLIVAKLIKAPVFYIAVGSQANVGGAASAPIVASAFHPSLAPVGVLLAVFGYALGTYMALICGQILHYVSDLL